MSTNQPFARMLSSLAATSPPFENEPINASIELHECYPGGDLLLIMSRCSKRRLGSECDRLSHIFDADDDTGDATKVLSTENDEEEEQEEIATRPPDCHFRVSSQCMILASPVFRAMLQGDFKESFELNSTGELRLPLPDDDPDIFSILLDILHHRTKKVPRLVSLGRLTKLAMLVDKYQMQESIEVFSDMWMEGLQGRKCDLPCNSTPDVLPWLFISWVFQKEKLFRQATKILQREGDAFMERHLPQEFPLPRQIIVNEIYHPLQLS
jgi:hypothetical protein